PEHELCELLAVSGAYCPPGCSASRARAGIIRRYDLKAPNLFSPTKLQTDFVGDFFAKNVAGKFIFRNT
ncbi:MAG: hypothetical protein D6814_15815, partial [Calditrichaeota bacterium]